MPNRNWRFVPVAPWTSRKASALDKLGMTAYLETALRAYSPSRRGAFGSGSRMCQSSLFHCQRAPMTKPATKIQPATIHRRGSNGIQLATTTARIRPPQKQRLERQYTIQSRIVSKMSHMPSDSTRISFSQCRFSLASHRENVREKRAVPGPTRMPLT